MCRWIFCQMPPGMVRLLAELLGGVEVSSEHQVIIQVDRKTICHPFFFFFLGRRRILQYLQKKSLFLSPGWGWLGGRPPRRRCGHPLPVPVPLLRRPLQALLRPPPPHPREVRRGVILHLQGDAAKGMSAIHVLAQGEEGGTMVFYLLLAWRKSSISG